MDWPLILLALKWLALYLVIAPPLLLITGASIAGGTDIYINYAEPQP